MKFKSIFYAVVCFASVTIFLCDQIHAKDDPTKDQVEKLMAGRVMELKRGGDIKVVAKKISDPLKSPFELYRVSYSDAGKPMGEMTVSVVEKDGKKFLLNGGAVWDMQSEVEMQFLWRSLTDKVEIPYNDDHLIAGKAGCAFPVAVFSDYLCVHCKRFMPEIRKLVSEKPDLCLYFYDFPLSTIHKNARYIAQLSAAYKELSGESVPDSIYTRNFQESQNTIEEYFEDLIAAKNIQPKAFYKKASSPEIADRIDNDLRLAKSLDIQGTPAAYLDGHTVVSTPDKVLQLLGHIKEMKKENLIVSDKGK